jgi:hypothetical protein
MSEPLTRRPDAIAWAAFALFVSALIVLTGFTSDDPDSALYASLSARLAAGPLSLWIAPEWWGHWEMEGLFREHPAGVFFLPTLLGTMGVPAVQAAYVVGVLAGLASLLLIGHLVARVTTPGDGRMILVLLQIMPMASIFRIRANHEYPMLVCLLVTLVGLDAVRRSWRWWWVAPLALTSALFVKGVFVAIPLMAAGLWIVVNPTGATGSNWRPIVSMTAALAAMGGAVLAYDQLYMRATGMPFWNLYWARQMAPLTVSAPIGADSTFLAHVWFYLVRMAWHPAPWSLALLAAAWRWRGTTLERWRAAAPRTARGLLFVLTFAAACVLLLSPASRFAERYTFSANYAVAAAGAVIALRLSPTLAGALTRLDTRVPALPAVCWLVLMLLRLVVGPYLPRLSW